jgi:hypothetical protein
VWSMENVNTVERYGNCECGNFSKEDVTRETTTTTDSRR